MKYRNLVELYDSNRGSNILIYNAGGFGKTMQMKNLNKHLLAHLDQYKTIPLYIDAKSLDKADEKPILKYVTKMFCGIDITNTDEVEMFFEKRTGVYAYSYLFLIDAINEADDAVKAKIVTDIRRLKESDKIRFIVSSRVNEGYSVFNDFHKYEFLELTDEQIGIYLSRKFSKSDIEVERFNKSLVDILKIPMYLSVFSYAYKDETFPELYGEKTVRKADLLLAYLYKVAEESRMDKNLATSLEQEVQFTIEHYLPALAFKMCCQGKVSLKNEEYKEIKKELNTEYFFSFFDEEEREEFYPMLSQTAKLDYEFQRIARKRLALWCKNGEDYAFSHQNWLHFFAARHIVNLMNAQKIDELEYPMNQEVRRFAGELICEYDKQFKYSKSNQADTDRCCECDFEKKDNLTTWSASPIEQFMQRHNLMSASPLSPLSTRNLIEIMKTGRDGNVTAAYDHLDLKYVTFYKCNLQKSSFNNTKIYEHNFIPQGHTGIVTSVAFSPDGKRIVSGSRDGTVRLWDAETVLQIGDPLVENIGFIVSVTFSSDGKKIVIVGKNKFICIWNTETDERVVNSLERDMRHIYILCSAAISSNCKQIAIGYWKRIIRIWNTETREWIGKPLVEHTNVVESVAFSPDGKKIISGSRDKTIRIWDIENCKQIGDPLVGHTDDVTSVAFSPNGEKVVSGSRDKTIRIWDARTGKQIGEPLKGHASIVTSVAFSPDGKKIVSGSWDKTIRIWDARTGKQIGEPLKGHAKHVTTVSFSPDGGKIVSGSEDHTICVWNVKIGEPISKQGGYQCKLSSVSFSPDGKLIASGDSSGAIRMWSAESGKQIGIPFEGHTDWVDSVAFLKDGEKIVSGSSDTIRMWDMKSHKLACQELKVQKGFSVTFSHDKKKIVMYSIFGNGWDVETGKRIENSNGTIWEIETCKQVGDPLVGHTDGVTSVSFSSDGKKIVSGSWDKTVRIWDAKTGKQIGKTLEGHMYGVKSVAFSPDEKKIISGDVCGTIYIWDTKNQEKIEVLFENMDGLEFLLFSPNGNRIVSFSDFETIQIYDTETGSKIVSGIEGTYIGSAFSSDGETFATAGWDNTIHMWNMATGEQIETPLKGHTDCVNSLVFSPDGKKVVSCSADETIRIWDLENQSCMVIQGIAGLCIVDSDFSNADYIWRNEQENEEEFYKRIYSSGGIVPKKFIPKPIPFETDDD